MSNVVFGYPDLLFPDARVTTPALTGGAWSSALPLSNLFKLDFASVARSANTLEASTQFWADLGLQRGVRIVAIPKSNASRIAKIRVRGCSILGTMEISPSYALDLTTVTSFGPELLRWNMANPGYESANAKPTSGVRVASPAAISAGAYTVVLEWTGDDNVGTIGGLGTAGGWTTGSLYFNKTTAAPFGATIAFVPFTATHWLPGWVSGRNRLVFSVSPTEVVLALNGAAPSTMALPAPLPAYVALTVGGSPWDISTGYSIGNDGMLGAPLYGAVYPGTLSPAEVKRLSVVGANPVAINPANPPVVDTDWTDVYQVIYAPGTRPWGDPSLWDGRMDEEAALAYTMPWLAVFDTSCNARYWLVEFSDVGNPAGYFELSRIIIASGWQPTRNFLYGVSLVNNDDTQVQTTAGGADFFDQRARRRIVRFSINNLPQAEALAWANDMQHALGISGQVFFVYNPDDPENWRRRCFLSRMSTLSPLVAAVHGRLDTTFELTEIIA
jgi:hypothetical protein